MGAIKGALAPSQAIQTSQQIPASAGQAINLTKNPVQIPINDGGSTLINNSGHDVTLCTNSYFASGDTVDLANGISLPWPTKVCYAFSTDGSPITIIVVGTLLNYFSPNVIVPSSQQLITEAAWINNAVVGIPNCANSTRTLILEISGNVGHPITNVLVLGNGSGLEYFNRAPYLSINLPSSVPIYQIFIPVLGPLESGQNYSFAITITGGAGSGGLFAAYTDTVTYDDSLFYNGFPVVMSGIAVNPTPAALTTGPCRLLSAQCSNSASSQCSIDDVTAGRSIIYTYDGQPSSLTFPWPGLLIPGGHVIQVSSNTSGDSAGCITYAYP